MTRRQINLRISEVTQGQLDDLAARGYTITTAVTVALDRMWHQECNSMTIRYDGSDWQSESGFYEGDDRNRQISALQGMAADISFGSDDRSTPVADRVAYYIDNGTMPPWFDDHDRDLLIELVEKVEAE